MNASIDNTVTFDPTMKHPIYPHPVGKLSEPGTRRTWAVEIAGVAIIVALYVIVLILS